MVPSTISPAQFILVKVVFQPVGSKMLSLLIDFQSVYSVQPQANLSKSFKVLNGILQRSKLLKLYCSLEQIQPENNL